MSSASLYMRHSSCRHLCSHSYHHDVCLASMQVLDFTAGNIWKVMVASYETLRKYTDTLAGAISSLHYHVKTLTGP